MRAIAHALLHVLPIFWILIALGLLLRKKRPRLSNYILIGALLWLALFCTPPVPQWLVNNLEKQYPPLVDPTYLLAEDSAIHILVLGGGHVSDPRFTKNDQLSQMALGRLVEGIRLHRLLPGSKLVLSGYSRIGIAESHAEVMAGAAELLGVNPEMLLTVETPANTEEEARDYRAKFGDTHRLILVTSAIHMPRAMFLFRAAELDPVPAPTNHQIKKDNLPKPLSLYPATKNLQRVSDAMHEYVGLWYATWKSRE